MLELCLSHHDELRSTAVNVLFSLIVNEWTLNQSFGTIQSDVIDRLDKLFSSRRRDEVRFAETVRIKLTLQVSVSRSFFLQQLKELFDTSPVVDPALREGVEVFLESVGEFLDLLLGIRSLPETDEFVEDRVVGTLKFVGSSPP